MYLYKLNKIVCKSHYVYSFEAKLRLFRNL